MPGTLYVVATPIGNLEDITLRALRVLREDATLIACEDTRQTQKLLSHYDIHKPLISYHEHNETFRAADLIDKLLDGKSVALVSDAGTPLVSDPGYRIVTAAIENGIPVVSLPGASALLAALTASGMPTDSFLFVGFVPSKTNARRKALETAAAQHTTVVLYESPHRILETLASIHEIFGTRKIVLARELSKVHEEFLRGSAEDIRRELAGRASIKGEITLVIGPAEPEISNADPAQEVAQLESEGVPRMDAIKSVAKRLGLPKRQVYRDVEERGSNPLRKSCGLDRSAR
ncbi:MAG TPA: 16S rRNA (cytidine(1402)-2'-O)-methyltransferase [Bryobacteraceae bacterium]